MEILASQLPCEEAEFLDKFEEYKRARASAETGEEAPFPEFEIMRVIVDRGEDVQIVRSGLQEQAKEIGRDALAELDALAAQVAALQKKVDAL